MKDIYLIASGAVVLSLGLSAEEMPGQATFQQLDQDSDGYVSIVEATGQTELLRQWSTVDTDTDGKLEITEFSAFEEEPATYVPAVDPDDVDIGARPTE